MARTKQMKLVEEMIAEKLQTIAKLQIEVATLQEALARGRGEAPIVARSRARRSNVKGMILDLLKERGRDGLNAAIAVDMSAKRGEPLEKGTVSSLLSRLKADGIVEHDGVLYRLSNPKPAAPLTAEEMLH